jgi:cupin fold WbuC family metalloprotein
MEFKRLNDEVLYTAERITRLDDGDMRELVAMAARNPRKRVRICTHADPDDLLHEMFIVHTNEAYVRPHRHTSRDESFHVLSGFADIVIFAEDGSVAKAVRVGGYESGHPFYCRIPCGTMHMVVIRSPRPPPGRSTRPTSSSLRGRPRTAARKSGNSSKPWPKP